MSDAMTDDYADHDEYQMRGATSHEELVAAAAGGLELRPTRDAFVLADYGCAQGRVSNALIRRAIEVIRAEHHDEALFVYHNDVLANDWGGLFDRLRGDDAYPTVAGGPITPLVSATSFYDPVTPPGLVDLGLSFAAIQWLAEPGPAGTGSALYFDQLEGPAADAMAEQAHRDWCTFLDRRARELAPGGRMVLDMMGRSDVATGHEAWALVRSLAEELVDEGRLAAELLDGYVFPVYERTEEEVRRAFDGDTATPLRLEHLALADIVNPASDRYRQDGDAAAFARDFVGFFRAFSEPSLRQALDPGGEALAELYERMEARLRDEAADFDFVVHALTVVLSLPAEA